MKPNPYMNPKFELLRKRWYNDRNVIFQIVDNLRQKEGVFLRYGKTRKEIVAHRGLKINATHYFYKNAERYHFWDEPLNVYSSLSHFQNLPMLSFNKSKKSEEYEEWNKQYKSMMCGYDFFIDVDFKNELDLRHSYAQTKAIKEIFDKNNISYILTFSGNKGWHLRIVYEDFPGWMKDYSFPKLIELLKSFTLGFSKVIRYNLMDASVVDMKRIFKTPYSVTYPHYLICLPQSDEQFANFRFPRDVSLIHWLNKTKDIYKRGLLKRPGDSESFGKLVNKYSNL